MLDPPNDASLPLIPRPNLTVENRIQGLKN